MASILNRIRKRAALYIRVSTTHQIDKDSLPLQRSELPAFCKLVLGIEDYEIFEDAGYSAKNTNRPKYQQMMERVRAGEFSHIVVWKIDRISRNLLDFASMYEELKDLGVTFVSKNEQFDTSSPIGEAMLKIILVFAELERKMTAERVTAVMLSRAADGKWNGGRIPFGYAYDKLTGDFTIIEEEAKIVREIFESYSRTGTCLSIARSLNERKLYTRTGEWSATTIWGVLTNPWYYGTFRYNYRNESKGLSEWSFRTEDEWVLVHSHHQAIITKELFDICQDKLDRNNLKKRGSIKTYKRKNVHVFGGLITCGACGQPFLATIDRPRKDGFRPSMYLCTRHRKTKDCNNKFISDLTLGKFALNYIANMLRASNSFGKTTSIETLEKKLLRGPIFADVDHIERIGLEETYALLRSEKYGDVYYEPPAMADGSSSGVDERELLDREKRKVERALDRLKDAYLFGEGGMSPAAYTIEVKKLTDRLAEIDSKIQQEDDKATTERNMSDSEFMARASYFALTQELFTKREVDYKSLIRYTDPEITKDFVNTICSNFCILDGKIISIRFKNGIEHKFVYKKTEP